MALIEMKTATITEKGQISIPRELRKMKGFKEGEKIALIAFDNRIELIPLKELNEKMFTMLASEKAFAQHWNTKKEDEAWKDL